MTGYRILARLGGGVVIVEPGGRRVELAARWSEALLGEIERVAPEHQPAFIAGAFIAAAGFVAAIHELVSGAAEPRRDGPTTWPRPGDAA